LDILLEYCNFFIILQSNSKKGKKKKKIQRLKTIYEGNCTNTNCKYFLEITNIYKTHHLCGTCLHNIYKPKYKKNQTCEECGVRRGKKDGLRQWMGPRWGSPSPHRRENFEISLPSNGVSLQLRLNSIAFCLHTIHYNKALFSTQ